MMNSGRGRPVADGTDRRARILAVAADLFSTEGYQATTLRRVAESAGCDVALVSYYFGSKRGLFAEVMRLVVGPSEVVRRALQGERSGMPSRLAREVVTAWEDPVAGPRLVALARAALASPEVQATLDEYFEREVIAPLVEFLGGRDARVRAAAVFAVVAGTVFTRYVLGVESSRALPAEQTVAHLAGLVDAALRQPPRQPARRVLPSREPVPK